MRPRTQTDCCPPGRRLAPVGLATIVVALCAGALCWGAPSTPVRIKDIATVAGTTGERLMGYGLVVGLEGSGDSSKSSLTSQALANMLEHFSLKVTAGELATQNVAAVIVTADLPTVVRQGDRLDATVASVGDAKSVYGGVLLPTPLRGNDNDVYVIAQGPVSIGGYSASSGGQKTQKNHPLTARIVGGGTVVKGVAPAFDADSIHLTLRQPDFTTALRVADAINEEMGASIARAVAAESVQVMIPQNRAGDVVSLIADIEGLPVMEDTAARVVVNERTGTVIIGGDVRILPVAIAHGSLTITVTKRAEVSQPLPFTGNTTVLAAAEPPVAAPVPRAATESASQEPAAPPAVNAAAAKALTAAAKTPPAAGEKPAPRAVAASGARTAVTEKTKLKAEESAASLVELQPQTRLGDLVSALNALGVKPRDLIAILQALRAANALQAELVLM